MSQENVRPYRIFEWWLAIALPVFAILAGAAMIGVASDFGFTALGEPVVSPHG